MSASPDHRAWPAVAEASGPEQRAAARRRLARVPAMAEPELLEVVARVAKGLRENEAELVSEISAVLARDIDDLDADPVLVEMLQASVHGNASTIIHVLANDIPIDHLQPTTAAVEYALRLAQRDVPSNSLVRAYRLGQNEVMGRCYAIVEQMELPSSMAMAAIRHISEVLFSYIDWITLYVFAAYEEERRRWIGVEGNVLSSAIHQLLNSSATDVRPFEHETGYLLDQFHLSAIIWAPDHSVADLSVLDRAVRDVGTRLFAEGKPILTAIDRTTVWAWLPLGQRAMDVQSDAVADRIDLPPGVRVALGLPGRGVRGFRRSHEQAKAAYGVATAPGSPTGEIVGFGDRGIAVVSLLARDIESTRAWVHEVLGGLADDTPAAATLRSTLSTYFATKDSHLHTAEQLNLHRNTVKYRIGKALSIAPAHRDRLDLALALAVCEFLGPAVIGDD